MSYKRNGAHIHNMKKNNNTEIPAKIANSLLPLATPIENIDLLPGNPRKGDIQAVSKSYETFGQRKPIVVKKTGENEKGFTGIVIAGNHQLQAAKNLGWKKIAAVFVEDDDETAKAYALADNRTAELGGYDPEALAKLVEELRERPDLLGATGWTDDDLAEIIGGSLLNNIEITDDIPDLPKKIITKKGDIWNLGKHILICGDSLDDTNYKTLLGKDKADMILTDPPWNVNYGGNDHPSWKKRSIKNDNLSEKDWDKFINGFSKKLYEYTKPGSPIYLFMSAQEWPQIDKALRNNGFHWSSTIIWVKDSIVLSRKDYHTQYEPIWQGHNGPFDPIFYGWNEDSARLAQILDRTQSDVWLHERPKRSELHPTTKPIGLLARAIENSSKMNGIILDNFAGSGSTIMACIQTGRIARAIELDEGYCDIIATRYQEQTGDIPKLNGKKTDMSKNFKKKSEEND